MAEPDLEHFQSIPWCNKLLSDPTYAIMPTYSRKYQPSTEDSLFAQTLKTSETIPACISFHKLPPPGISWVDEVRTLLTLGTAMNGGPHLCHGGMLAALMDEVMGLLLTRNKYQPGTALGGDTVTAALNISYLKPVFTPQTVLVVATCRRIEGRKFFLDAEVRDGDGVVLVKSNAMWVNLNKPREVL